MVYLLSAIIVLLLGRGLSGSWRTTVLLPWVLVTVPLFTGAWLANLDLIPFLISPWSPQTHAVVIAGLLALFIGSFTWKQTKVTFTAVSRDIEWNERMALRVLMSATIVAALANAAQFLIAGTIPLFSADPDHARTEAARNGYIHVFSVLSGHIVPIIALILATGGKLGERTKRTLKRLMVVNLILLALWVARGMLIYPVLTAYAIYYILDQRLFTFRKIAAMTLVLLFIVSGVKYLRDVVRFGESHEETQKQLVAVDNDFAILGPAVSFYLTVAYNYEVLDRYVDAVPAFAPHTHGRILAAHVLSYLPGTGIPFTELDYQNRILKKNEEDLTLTSTLLGIPYLEFGLPGVFLAGLAVGFLYRFAWLRMLSKGTPWSIYLYGYLISMVVFIPYTFIYTQISFTWFLLASYPLIFLCLCRGDGVSLFYRDQRVTFLQA